MAYVLGFIFADGSVVTNKRGGKYLEFASTDLELVEKLKKMIGSSHKIGIYRSKYKHHKIRYTLQIGSSTWAAALKKFGIVQRKSLIIGWPKVPKTHLGSFVRGYFDGDGCISFGNYKRKNRLTKLLLITTRFTSGSKKFLRGLWGAIKPIVTGGYLYQKQRSGHELVFAAKDSLALFRLMYHNVSSDAFLERKFNKFKQAFAGVA